jgi:hypothetical protein
LPFEMKASSHHRLRREVYQSLAGLALPES